MMKENALERNGRHITVVLRLEKKIVAMTLLSCVKRFLTWYLLGCVLDGKSTLLLLSIVGDLYETYSREGVPRTLLDLLEPRVEYRELCYVEVEYLNTRESP